MQQVKFSKRQILRKRLTCRNFFRRVLSGFIPVREEGEGSTVGRKEKLGFNSVAATTSINPPPLRSLPELS